MSGGQEATCDCAGCVKHRGGRWLDVNREALERAAVERKERALVEAEALVASLKLELKR